MKSLFCCTVVTSLLLASLQVLAQQKSTPSPFPGWANKTTPAPGAPGGAGAANDNSDFLGEWVGILATGDGSNPNQKAGDIALSITKDKIVATGSGNTNGDGTYRISAGSGKIRNIDSTGTGGNYRGKQFEGIFVVEGNTLKWCSGQVNRGRPTELKTVPGAGFFLMVLTRKN